MNAEISVLLSIFKGTNPAYLLEAITSIVEQSLQPSEIIIVCDGELTDPVEKILSEFKAKTTSIVLKVIRLEHNQGLGDALRTGLDSCVHEFIARIDDDDVSKPDRLEIQYNFLNQNPDISLVGSWIKHFSRIKELNEVRRVPVEHEAIVKFAKFRNPINHPTVMFRKSDVIEAGSYRSNFGFEDYDLWIRMIQTSLKLANIPQSLVLYRVEPDFYLRRHGWKYVKHQYQFYKWHFNSGFFNGIEFTGLFLIRSVGFLLPLKLKAMFYKLIRIF